MPRMGTMLEHGEREGESPDRAHHSQNEYSGGKIRGICDGCNWK